MKLNRKGYMLIEIIIASFLAMIISYYLLNLTYKFKNTSQDIQESYHFLKDKILITKNIMSDLENGTIDNVTEIFTEDSQIIEFDFTFKKNKKVEKRMFKLNKNDSGSEIKYGKISNVSHKFITTDPSYYEKKLEPSLIVGELVKIEEKNSVTIIIPIKSIYNDNDYSIKLYANK